MSNLESYLAHGLGLLMEELKGLEEATEKVVEELDEAIAKLDERVEALEKRDHGYGHGSNTEQDDGAEGDDSGKSVEERRGVGK
ncbi:hypothetical protein LCGC14_1101760 [marine sediment metagenome]|uniref:Uncharacterized protein n=1 Tax=marine sediment metagenome TaxID=412755 RepID=A0A0F9QFF3_9ZZZZ